MKTLRSSILQFLSFLLFAHSSFAAPDPGWLAPLDGESFAVVPALQQSAEDGVFVVVEVPRTVPFSGTASILDGNTVVGVTHPDWRYTGPRRFSGVARLQTTGTRTLSLRLSDGFTITTIEGPVIHVVNPAPAPTFEQGSATSITSNSATLRVPVNLHGVGYKNVAFEYGTTSAYGKSFRVYGYRYDSSGIQFGFQMGVSPYSSVNLADILEPATEYHYRLIVDGVAGPDNVFVTAPNQPPVAREDVLVVDASGVGVPACLSNDSDDGVESWRMYGGSWWSLVGVSQPAHGQVEFSLDGSTIRYTAGGTFQGADEFFYTVRDRHGAESIGRVVVRDGSTHMAAVAGAYSTAVLDGTPKPIGSLDFQLTKTGHFTGVLVYYGRRFPILDRFTLSPEYPQGLWTELELPREGQPPLLLSFGIGYSHPDNIPTLTAGIYTSDGEFNLPESPQLIPPTEQVPEAGQFNIAMANPDAVVNDDAAAPEEPDLFGVPQGNGFARMRVKRSGSVTVAGRMPDNRPFASGTRIRVDRKAMVNSKIGSDRRGSLYGIMGFSVLAGTGGDGDMTWSNPERSTGMYRSEFNLTMNAKGRTFTPPRGRAPALYFPAGTPQLVRVIVRNHAGGIITDQTRLLDARNLITSDSGSQRKLHVSLNPKTGLFTGKVLERGKPAIPLAGLLQPILRRGVGISGKTGFEGTVEIIAL